MQPMWLCVLPYKQFEKTFKNTQRRKVKQMQSMWFCIRLWKQFEGTFENPQWRKHKEMYVNLFNLNTSQSSQRQITGLRESSDYDYIWGETNFDHKKAKFFFFTNYCTITPAYQSTLKFCLGATWTRTRPRTTVQNSDVQVCVVWEYKFWNPWTILFSKICHMLGLSGNTPYALLCICVFCICICLCLCICITIW